MPEDLVKVGGRMEGRGALITLSGYNKDQPIYVTDGEMSDGSDDSDDDELTAVTTSHDDGRIAKAPISTNHLRSASPSSLPDMQASSTTYDRQCIDSATDDHRHSSDQSHHHGYINAASTYNGELEQHAVRHGFDLDLPSPHNEAVEEDAGQDGVSQHAPASAGIFHDVFAEYEKRFAMGGKKRSSLKPTEAHSPCTSPACRGSLDEHQENHQQRRLELGRRQDEDKVTVNSYWIF